MANKKAEALNASAANKTCRDQQEKNKCWIHSRWQSVRSQVVIRRPRRNSRTYYREYTNLFIHLITTKSVTGGLQAVNKNPNIIFFLSVIIRFLI